MKRYACEACWFRRYAERKPDSIIARIWRWHTGWCPGWKAYQSALAETQQTGQQQAQAPTPASSDDNR